MSEEIVTDTNTDNDLIPEGTLEFNNTIKLQTLDIIQINKKFNSLSKSIRFYIKLDQNLCCFNDLIKDKIINKYTLLINIGKSIISIYQNNHIKDWPEKTLKKFIDSIDNTIKEYIKLLTSYGYIMT